jgi:hypothetical protein
MDIFILTTHTTQYSAMVCRLAAQAPWCRLCSKPVRRDLEFAFKLQDPCKREGWEIRRMFTYMHICVYVYIIDLGGGAHQGSTGVGVPEPKKKKLFAIVVHLAKRVPGHPQLEG